MKYPQLVSTRAVNAISDWLGSRLEQLGVEAPQIYTRLLLSLLQSSVQINDPIEFTNLEIFVASRKGQHRRYMPSDSDALKKLNAVQCLRDIVSSEQEIATIERLVDELFEKLRDIEGQSTDIEDVDQILLATLTASTAHATAPHHQQQQQTHHQDQKHHRAQAIEESIAPQLDCNNCEGITSVPVEEATAVVKAVIDIETDPRKRYFRAFPALTKEMEDSFRIWRQNAKSLTWPVVDRANLSLSSDSSTSSTTSSSSFSGTSGARHGGNGPNLSVENFATGGACKANYSRPNAENLKSTQHCDNNATTAAVVKKKTRRRRYQALSKGKATQNLRKNSSGNTAASGVGVGVSVAGSAAPFGRRHYRNSSPSCWDTEFEGCWEMGRDLIKEFITKQNKNVRNRSTSESAAYQMKQAAIMAEEESVTRGIENQRPPLLVQQQPMDRSGEQTTPVMPAVDISFCCEDDFDDTLGSVSEMTTDTSLSHGPPARRRLYQRDASGILSSRELLPTEGAEHEEGNDSLTVGEEQLDFARFKAKFNSSVEALWNDADPVNESTTFGPLSGQIPDTLSLGVTGLQMSSVSAVHAFKENLRSFWTNYYSHHFDVAKMPQPAAMHSLPGEESSVGLTPYNNLIGGSDLANTSDYFSMPNHTTSNIETMDFEKSVGGMRRNLNEIGSGNTLNSSSSGVFFGHSIWSENSFADSSVDMDETFARNIWNCNKNNQDQMSATANGSSKQQAQTQERSGYQFPPYQVSKWSEGINAGPQQFRLQVENAGSNKNNMLHNISIDCTDAAPNQTAPVSASASGSSSFTQSSASYSSWQTPIMGQQNLQPDLQSWSTSDPHSLTELYGTDGNVSRPTSDTESAKFSSLSSFSTATAAGAAPAAPGSEEINPTITLPNHCTASSGFVEYARIKPQMKLLHQEAMVAHLQAQSYASRPSHDRYPEDENLLTSELTHFHPIKSFNDGHTFDICGALDTVEYERSQSGFLYLDSDKYMEYKRKDKMLVDEETTAGGVGASAMPLYASSNCEAAIARINDAHGKGKRQTKVEDDFIIKFRVSSNDMSCQTEDEAELMSADNNQKFSHPLSLFYSGAATTKRMQGQTTGLACDGAIAAINKAVEAAAETLARMSSDHHWLPGTFPLPIGANCIRSATIWDNTVPPPVVGGYDEVDFGGGTLEEQWPMHDLGTRSEINSGCNNCNNNNEDMDPDGSGRGEHALWGMCAACNSEFKSAPADRMMRDELNLEADEIMSDLRNMQDLYIGRGNESDTDDYEDDEDEEEEMVSSNNSDWDADAEDSVVLEGNDFDSQKQPNKENEAAREEDVADGVQQLSPTQPQAQAVLQQMNRMIVDLLRAENMEPDCGKEKEAVVAVDPLVVTESEEAEQNSWYDNVAHSIWHVSDDTEDQANQNNNHNSQSITPSLKTMQLLQHFQLEPPKSSLQVDDKFLAQLSWEHDNLAEIWQKDTPPLTPPLLASQLLETQSAVPGNDDNVMCSSISAVGATQMDAEQFQIEKEVCERNMKNLQNNANNSSSNAFETKKMQFVSPLAYKRVQQFLNSNASATTKLKLANRKRRHSASQNFFHSPTVQSSNNNNNNNIDEIANLNRYGMKMASKGLASGVSTMFDVDIDNNLLRRPDNERKDYEAVRQPKQTIITCKYWTTLDPMQEPAEETFEDHQMCLMDKGASMLKHVTMASRPLTR